MPSNGRKLGPALGFGVHGNVFTLDNQTNTPRSAIKIHERERYYLRERDVYRRLAEEGITSILNFTVPEMLGYDDDLLVIEMSIVTPPYVLDFAGAYLDIAPDYPEDVLAEWQQEKAEQFGPHWRTVQTILRKLENIGIYLSDINPGNIRAD